VDPSPPAPIAPQTPWLEGRPWGAEAGKSAFAAGWLAALVWLELLLVTVAGAVTAAAGGLLQVLAWHLGLGDPLRQALLLFVAASLWTWLGAAWARFAVSRALDLLERRSDDASPERCEAATAASALAVTPALALVLVPSGALQLLGPGTTGTHLAIFSLAALAFPVAVVLGLLLPLGACALTLGRGLPPLAALAAVLRGALRGWLSLLVVVLAHTTILCVLVALSGLLVAAFPGGLLLWLVWIPFQGAAGSTALVALSLGWASSEAAPEPWAPRWTAAPPPPPRWLLPAAGALLRVAFGATLATGPMAAAAGALALPVGALGVAAGVIAAPWLIGAALLHLQLTRHRSVVLDDHGLRLDVGPTWPGRRVPWTRVRGARARDDGVALVLRWSPSDVLVRLPGDQVDPLLQWLHARGVRRVDAG